MKRRFSVLYILAGCAFVWLMSLGGESPTVTLFAGAVALLCFFTAWQGWFNSGVLWKILHTLFGVVTVGACLAAWAYTIPYMTGMSRRSDMGIAEMLVGIAAAILTLPAVAYVISAVTWLRAGRNVGGTQAARDSVPTSAPPVARVEAEPAATPARAQSRVGGRSTVGTVLAALGVAAVLAWVRYGSDVRCELDAAVATYDRVIARQQAKDPPGTKLVSIAWGERDAILIQQGAYARLDAIALEACPDRPVACRDLINVLDKAGERTRADKAFRRYCETAGGESCASYAKWLVDKGEAQVGLTVLQKHCDSSDIMACLEYGSQLARAKQFDEARAALKRACVLQAEAKSKGREPTMYAVCQSYIRMEKPFVTSAQLREDAREVCLAYLTQCADVAGVIASESNNADAARQIVEEACAKHGVNGPTSGTRICGSMYGYTRQNR
jgi:hypothetical protein